MINIGLKSINKTDIYIFKRLLKKTETSYYYYYIKNNKPVELIIVKLVHFKKKSFGKKFNENAKIFP